jgi:hypothetical protein
MKMVKPGCCWSMSGVPYPTARNLARPFALTRPFQVLVVDMTWLMELAASRSWTSWAVKRFRTGAVSLQCPAKRTGNKVAELVASFERIYFFCASRSAVLRNMAVEAVRFWKSAGSRASIGLPDGGAPAAGTGVPIAALAMVAGNPKISSISCWPFA